MSPPRPKKDRWGSTRFEKEDSLVERHNSSSTAAAAGAAESSNYVLERGTHVCTCCVFASCLQRTHSLYDAIYLSLFLRATSIPHCCRLTGGLKAFVAQQAATATYTNDVGLSSWAAYDTKMSASSSDDTKTLLFNGPFSLCALFLSFSISQRSDRFLSRHKAVHIQSQTARR